MKNIIEEWIYVKAFSTVCSVVAITPYEKHVAIIVMWMLHLCLNLTDLQMVLSGVVVECTGHKGITNNFECYLSYQRLSLGYVWYSI